MNYLTKEFSPFSAQPQTHPQSQTNLSMKLEAKNIYGASYNWNFPLGAQQENVGDPKQSEEIHQGLTICDSTITKFG